MKRLRLAILAAAVLGSLGMLAATARADNASDAAAVADKFVVALVTNDGATACSVLSPRALAALGGPEKCPPHFAADSGSADYDALETLSGAYAAARRSSAARRGDFVRKRFTVRQLARDMERIDSDLTVKVGKGPKAAAGQLSTTAVLDTRTNARRVVIYAEADSGTIYRVTGTAFTDPRLQKVAQGIPEAPKPPPTPQPLPPTLTHTVTSVTFASNGTAYVSETIADSSDQSSGDLLLKLVPSASGYLVDDVFLSFISLLQAADEAGSGLSGAVVVVGP